MSALRDGGGLKFIHQYGVGLHSGLEHPPIGDPAWQQRQIDDFIAFTAKAEALGYDGVTLTEHHAPMMTCPSPHLLIAAAARETSELRLGTAVTILPLYHPVRVAEEAGTLDLITGGRFELGIGRGSAGEARVALGQGLDDDALREAWLEGVELLHLALTTEDFTFDGRFYQAPRPTTIATKPLQADFPVWVGSTSLESVALAGRHGWGILRNFGPHEHHRAALDALVAAGAEHGHALSGANMQVERFIAIGRTAAEVEAATDVMTRSVGQFLSLYGRNGREVPTNDGEFQMDTAAPRTRPAIAVTGTPAEIIAELQHLIDTSGTRRIMIEAFADPQSELFAREVIPALREANPG
jgi:alkanesulfonate monooxygenase SsuD/methylene tetrahydromethanopterin reductase-like flavin-dependent oxidoreductase (luciferase family)